MSTRRNAENGGMKEEEEILPVRMNYGTIFSCITLQCFKLKLISNIVIKYSGAVVNHVIYVCSYTGRCLNHYSVNVVMFRSHRAIVSLCKVLYCNVISPLECCTF